MLTVQVILLQFAQQVEELDKSLLAFRVVLLPVLLLACAVLSTRLWNSIRGRTQHCPRSSISSSGALKRLAEANELAAFSTGAQTRRW